MGNRTCSIDGCERTILARGWCSTHYHKWHRYGDPLAETQYQPRPDSCTADGCDGEVQARGWCQTHYMRWKRNGTLEVDRVWGDPETSFWAKVDVGDCWEFTGTTRDGYGLIWNGEAMENAHRFAWKILVGPIPEGLTLDHLCRNRVCVNPDHMEPVTAAENTRRGYGVNYQNRRKTHCVNGHEFTPENTGTQRGGRRCKQCVREWRERNRDEINARRRQARATAK